MNALALLDAVAERLVAHPPGDVPADYIAGYFARNREALARTIQPRLDALATRRAARSATATALEDVPADRGPRIDPERAARGQRVVLPSGEHGEIARVLHYTTTIGRLGEEREVEHSYHIDVRLDSGRTVS